MKAILISRHDFNLSLPPCLPFSIHSSLPPSLLSPSHPPPSLTSPGGVVRESPDYQLHHLSSVFDDSDGIRVQHALRGVAVDFQ